VFPLNDRHVNVFSTKKAWPTYAVFPVPLHLETLPRITWHLLVLVGRTANNWLEEEHKLLTRKPDMHQMFVT
jgi:hypothetical protein